MESIMPILLIGMVGFLAFSMYQRRKQAKNSQQEQAQKLVPGSVIMNKVGVYGTIVAVDKNNDTIVMELAPGHQVVMSTAGIMKYVDADDVPRTLNSSIQPLKTEEGVIETQKIDEQFQELIAEEENLNKKNKNTKPVDNPFEKKPQDKKADSGSASRSNDLGYAFEDQAQANAKDLSNVESNSQDIKDSTDFQDTPGDEPEDPFTSDSKKSND